MHSLQASLPPLLDNTLELSGETQKMEVAGFRDAPVTARRFTPDLALNIITAKRKARTGRGLYSEINGGGTTTGMIRPRPPKDEGFFYCVKGVYLWKEYSQQKSQRM